MQNDFKWFSYMTRKSFNITWWEFTRYSLARFRLNTNIHLDASVKKYLQILNIESSTVHGTLLSPLVGTFSSTSISRRQFWPRFSKCNDKEGSNFLPWWNSAWDDGSNPLLLQASVITSASREWRGMETVTRCPVGQRTVTLFIESWRCKIWLVIWI